MNDDSFQHARLAEQMFRISLGLQQLNKRLEQLIGMSLVQWYVLRHLLEMPGVAVGTLAKEVGVHPGTLTPLLQRLKRKGMVFLERDGLDCRRKTVLISREGRTRLLVIEKELFGIMSACSHGHCIESEFEQFVIRCNEYKPQKRNQ